ncbi:MAG TPA: hypothetical protein VKX17_18500 [Planctomycetota bacterium]|nr:hypothetical protein [Planctomycetota bacterium]
MGFKIDLEVAGSDLDVRVKYDDPTLQGKAAFTLREDGISVGMTQSGKPVFVRIRGAQNFDSYVASLMNRIPALLSGKETLDATERKRLVSFATQKMGNVVRKHIERQMNDLKNIEHHDMENADLEVHGASV